MTGGETVEAGPLGTELAAWLRRPELRRLWAAVEGRLERNGIAIRGYVTVPEPTTEERQAVGELLGAPVTARGSALRVPLDRLDARLRSSAADRGLVDLLAALGRPVTDRAGARRASRDAWSGVWTDAREAVGVAGDATASDWVSGVRRSGLLARLGPVQAARLLDQAARTIVLLQRGAEVGRGDLAQRVTGSAHGLDDGAVLSRLVLRWLAVRAGLDPVAALGEAAGRRALWRSAGVVVDEVSSTVLTYGLRPTGSGWRESALRTRADHGQETHLTLREIAAVRWTLPPHTAVRVCENPRIVEVAATRGATGPLVCTAGNPATVVLDLLTRLHASGAGFLYHGDFDWPGIALANRIVERFGAAPWQMSAEDYESAVDANRRRLTPPLPLAGDPVEACWDAELTAAMTALGVAVHEESVADALLADL